MRLSTFVLTVVFAGALAPHVQVRPPPVAVAGSGTVETSVVPTPAAVPTVPRRRFAASDGLRPFSVASSRFSTSASGTDFSVAGVGPAG